MCKSVDSHLVLARVRSHFSFRVKLTTLLRTSQRYFDSLQSTKSSLCCFENTSAHAGDSDEKGIQYLVSFSPRVRPHIRGVCVLCGTARVLNERRHTPPVGSGETPSGGSATCSRQERYIFFRRTCRRGIGRHVRYTTTSVGPLSPYKAPPPVVVSCRHTRVPVVLCCWLLLV
jgi:hypothetical protein